MNETRKDRSTLQDILALGVFLFVCLVVEFLGAVFTFPSVRGWYAELAKPSWTPPNWVFTPVWTVLFLMMALAGWLVWRKGDAQASTVALVLFGIQLVLNAAWSLLFFTLQSPGWAFAEIVVLWCAILFTLLTFWRIRTVAGVLLLPYLLWVSYAAALNFALWRMNT